MDSATEERVRAQARHDFTMRKVDEAVENRLAELQGGTQVMLPPAQITVPPAQIYNDFTVDPTLIHNEVNVPAPVVHVDMTPVAMAIRDFTDQQRVTTALLVEELREKNEMLSQLLQVLAEQKAAKVVVNVPEQPAPQVVVNVPQGPRTAVVEHEDGTKSTVTTR